MTIFRSNHLHSKSFFLTIPSNIRYAPNTLKFEPNPLDNKKDICPYVPFRTFHDNSQVKPPPPKNTFLNSSSKNSDLNQICLSLKLKRYLVKDYFLDPLLIQLTGIFLLNKHFRIVLDLSFTLYEILRVPFGTTQKRRSLRKGLENIKAHLKLSFVRDKYIPLKREYIKS
jgi:hypothetical protein